MRMRTQEIADRRRLFELFTWLLDNNKALKEPDTEKKRSEQSHDTVKHCIALWTAMMQVSLIRNRPPPGVLFEPYTGMLLTKRVLTKSVLFAECGGTQRGGGLQRAVPPAPGLQAERNSENRARSGTKGRGGGTGACRSGRAARCRGGSRRSRRFIPHLNPRKAIFLLFACNEFYYTNPKP